MEIGIAEVDINIGGIRSLKNKRKIIKSLLKRIQNKFNLSVSEVDYHDMWQRSLLALVGVSNDKSHLNKVLEQAVNMIEEDGEMVIINYSIYFC